MNPTPFTPLAAWVAALDPITELPSLVPMTDTLLMEAAMVLWEAWSTEESKEWTATLAAANQLASAALPTPFTDYRDPIGTVQVRHDLMALVWPLHIGWHIHERAAGDNVLVPFDWEFAPWFLRECTVFEVIGGTGSITLRDDWMDLCRNVRGGL